MKQEQRDIVAQVLRNARDMIGYLNERDAIQVKNKMVRLTAAHCLARANIKWEG